MDTLVSVLQRLEAKLDAIDSRPSASRPPRPDPDPPYGMSSEWQAPSWTSEGLATHSVGGSIPPWPTMSSISSWPQLDPFRQNLHEYTNGMGFHTAGPPQYPSWEPPRSRAGDYIGHRSSWEQSASQGPSSSYEFDPILGRPLTSWDLPRPRIAPESCSNHSDWDYWVPPTYSESYGGGGGYSKYSNNYNDYYNNEPQAPWDSPWLRTNHESSYSHYGEDIPVEVMQTSIVSMCRHLLLRGTTATCQLLSRIHHRTLNLSNRTAATCRLRRRTLHLSIHGIRHAL